MYFYTSKLGHLYHITVPACQGQPSNQLYFKWVLYTVQCVNLPVYFYTWKLGHQYYSNVNACQGQPCNQLYFIFAPGTLYLCTFPPGNQFTCTNSLHLYCVLWLLARVSRAINFICAFTCTLYSVQYPHHSAHCTYTCTIWCSTVLASNALDLMRP